MTVINFNTYTTDSMTEKCLICMQLFMNPVISSDGNVYCETCIIEWNKKNDKSPLGTLKNTKWIKCPLLNRLYMSMQIIGDLNLLKLIGTPEFECEDKEDATIIMNMIDSEYYEQKSKNNNNININNLFINVFANSALINSIIDFLADTWIGRNGIDVPCYVLKYGSMKSIHFMMNKNIKFIDDSLKKMNCVNLLNEIVNLNEKSRFNCFDSYGMIKLIDFILNFVDLENEKGIIRNIFSKNNCFVSNDQLKIIELITKKLSKEVLEITDEKKMAPIHYLCSNSHNMFSQDQANAVRNLIECKVDLNQVDSEGKKPINYVCENSGSEVIKVLLNCPHIDFNNTYKNNLIFSVILNTKILSGNKCEIIKLLIDHGIEANVTDSQDELPIHHILNPIIADSLLPNDRFEIVKLLIESSNNKGQNFSANTDNRHVDSIINYVCKQNDCFGTIQYEYLKLLIPYFANRLQSQSLNSSLSNAVTNLCSINNNLKSGEQLDTIKLLLNNGVNLSMRDSMGNYPIHYICSNKNHMIDSKDQFEAVKLLFGVIDFNVISNNGMSAMHYLCSDRNNFNSSDQLKCINLMIQNKINFETPDNESWRGIQYLCCNQNKMCSGDQLDAIKQLIEYGVDVNSQDNNGYTPLHDVSSIGIINFCAKDRQTVIELLIDKGDADVSIRNLSGVSALIFVLACNSIGDTECLEIIKKLFLKKKSIGYVSDYMKISASMCKNIRASRTQLILKFINEYV